MRLPITPIKTLKKFLGIKPEKKDFSNVKQLIKQQQDAMPKEHPHLDDLNKPQRDVNEVPHPSKISDTWREVNGEGKQAPFVSMPEERKINVALSVKRIIRERKLTRTQRFFIKKLAEITECKSFSTRDISKLHENMGSDSKYISNYLYQLKLRSIIIMEVKGANFRPSFYSWNPAYLVYYGDKEEQEEYMAERDEDKEPLSVGALPKTEVLGEELKEVILDLGKKLDALVIRDVSKGVIDESVRKTLYEYEGRKQALLRELDEIDQEEGVSTAELYTFVSKARKEGRVRDELEGYQELCDRYRREINRYAGLIQFYNAEDLLQKKLLGLLPTEERKPPEEEKGE